MTSFCCQPERSVQVGYLSHLARYWENCNFWSKRGVEACATWIWCDIEGIITSDPEGQERCGGVCYMNLVWYWGNCNFWSRRPGEVWRRVLHEFGMILRELQLLIQKARRGVEACATWIWCDIEGIITSDPEGQERCGGVCYMNLVWYWGNCNFWSRRPVEVWRRVLHEFGVILREL